MKFVLYSKTNQDNSTKMFLPLLFNSTYIGACAMPRAKKDPEKVPTLKKTTGLCPSRCFYYLLWEAGGEPVEQRKEPGEEEGQLLPQRVVLAQLSQPLLSVRREGRRRGAQGPCKKGGGVRASLSVRRQGHHCRAQGFCFRGVGGKNLSTQLLYAYGYK